MKGRARLHYAWVVMGVTFVTLLVGAGTRAAPGVLIVPLEREFGWSNATISFAIALNILLYGLAGPFAAALLQRFGLRRCMVLALALIATGVALTTQMRAAWQLALLWGASSGSAPG